MSILSRLFGRKSTSGGVEAAVPIFSPKLPFFNAGANATSGKPQDVVGWVRYIHGQHVAGKLSPHYDALVISHDLKPSGHAVHAFSDGIMQRCGDKLAALGADPDANTEHVIDLLVKWTTALQCGHSHDVSKGYFHDAEPFIDMQWNDIIYPIIKDLDFTTVVDLACGHGRNSSKLKDFAGTIHLVDINQSCIDACRERFAGLEKPVFHYHVTDGNHMSMIADSTATLVYSWDSMVHFDKLIVRDYVADIARVLRPGGKAFLHHSNLGAKQPDSNWATNEGTRSDMSAEIMAEFARASGLAVVDQQLQGRAQGWGSDDLDCVSILEKPLV